MADGIITNIDNGPLVLKRGEDEQAPLTVGGAVTVLKGTILARDSVSFKFVPFVIGGSTNENGIPKAVLLHEVTSGGAGDVPVTAMRSGVVDSGRLIVDADGDDSNLTKAHLDQLRDYGIDSRSVNQLAVQDNQ